MKSFWHAWMIAAPTLNSLASILSTTILRPLMPPAALHHLVNTSATSKNSWPRPGVTVEPGSASTPMRIVFPLSPRADPPEAEPGAQTLFTEPKSPVAAALVELVAGAELLLVPPDPTSRSVAARPHPDATTPTTASDAIATAARPLRLL